MKNSPVALIKKAIGMLGGVKRVIVQEIPDEGSSKNQDLSGVPYEIQSLIGIASNINDDIAADDRLAYVLSK